VVLELDQRTLKIVRVVVPARDFERVSSVVKELERRAESVRFEVKRLFESRPDLDSVEYVFIISLSKEETKRYRSILSKRLSGTIGFFLIYDYKVSKDEL